MKNILGECYSKNGNCDNCTECCTVNLPLTKEEFNYLKKLITKEKINEYKLNINMGTIDLRCPFLKFHNMENRKGECTIYDKRPYICRVYHCNPNYAKQVDRKIKLDYKLIDTLPKDIKEVLNMYMAYLLVNKGVKV